MSSKVPAEKSTIAQQQDFSAVLQKIQRLHQIDMAYFGQSMSGAILSPVVRDFGVGDV